MLGVLSDTHSNLAPLSEVVRIFQEAGVKKVLHAGDLGDPAVLDYFKGFELYMVKGNCDDLDWLKPAFAGRNQPEPREVWEFQEGSKSIVLMHGDDARLYRKIIEEERFDYLLKGHTHFPEDFIKNKTRVLNPGALYRSPRYSVALFDPQNDSWQLKEISKGGHQ